MTQEERNLFANNFLGYGNPDNEVWFIGSEESAGWSKSEFEDLLGMQHDSLTENEWKLLINYTLRKNYYHNNKPVKNAGFYYVYSQNYYKCAILMKSLNEISGREITLEICKYKHLFNEYKDPNIINSFHINLSNIGKGINDDVNRQVLEVFGITDYDEYRLRRFRYIIEEANKAKEKVIIFYANKTTHQTLILNDDFFIKSFILIDEDPNQRFKFYKYNNNGSVKLFITQYLRNALPVNYLADLSEYISNHSEL